jgi:replication factor C subunit 3/5
MEVLQKISKKEMIQLPAEFAAELAKSSGRNLRRAILSLEASKVKQYPFLPNQKAETAEWEEFIAALAREIMNEQSARGLMSVRQKLYELLSHCIPSEIILRRLTLELLKKLDSELKYEVTQWAAHYVIPIMPPFCLFPSLPKEFLVVVLLLLQSYFFSS